MRKTKIVATLGPASNSPEALRQLIIAGVNVFRLNFSHGTAEEKKELVKLIRTIAHKENKVVGILADLQGPKIRVAKFKQGSVTLKENTLFTLDAAMDKSAGNESAVGIDYRELPGDVAPRDILLLDDGRLILEIEQVVDTKIICQVKVGGVLSNNKGINRQFGGLSAGALTDKDREDLKTAVMLDVDYIAISFVRSKSDVEETKQLIAAAGGNASVIAKIERIEAIAPENLQEIIRSADGVMVARGDLAVEIGDAEVPAAQKLIIKYARKLHKPVITATQMMETMIHNVTPTRAEVSDVANAVLDGTDAVMLSAETATGEHPALVVQHMAKICSSAEKLCQTIGLTTHHSLSSEILDSAIDHKTDEIIAMSAVRISNHLKVAAIICLTQSGNTPLLASRVASDIPIYGLSAHNQALGKMALYRGVFPIAFADESTAPDCSIKQRAIACIKQLGFIKPLELVTLTNNDTTEFTNAVTILEVK